MTNILIAIIAFLIIVTLVQILRVSELLSEINNTDVNEVTDEDNDTQGKLYLLILFLFFRLCSLANDKLESSLITWG